MQHLQELTIKDLESLGNLINRCQDGEKNGFCVAFKAKPENNLVSVFEFPGQKETLFVLVINGRLIDH